VLNRCFDAPQSPDSRALVIDDSVEARRFVAAAVADNA
jgi:hypothetical protein